MSCGFLYWIKQAILKRLRASNLKIILNACVIFINSYCQNQQPCVVNLLYQNKTKTNHTLISYLLI